LDVKAPALALFDLELQDLTGLVGAVSGWSAFPPKMASGDTPPLRLCGQQRGERRGVSSIQGLGGCPKLVKHALSMHNRPETRDTLTARRRWLTLRLALPKGHPQVGGQPGETFDRPGVMVLRPRGISFWGGRAHAVLWCPWACSRQPRAALASAGGVVEWRWRDGADR
jgi:hypothetical protein